MDGRLQHAARPKRRDDGPEGRRIRSRLRQSDLDRAEHIVVLVVRSVSRLPDTLVTPRITRAVQSPGGPCGGARAGGGDARSPGDRAVSTAGRSAGAGTVHVLSSGRCVRRGSAHLGLFGRRNRRRYARDAPGRARRCAGVLRQRLRGRRRSDNAEVSGWRGTVPGQRHGSASSGRQSGRCDHLRLEATQAGVMIPVDAP